MLFCKPNKKIMLIIGIAGGSGSGKTTVVKKIIEMLPKDAVSVIPQDAYYKDNGHLSAEERTQINFDHPASIEFELLNQQLDKLMNQKPIQMPIYNYVTCSRAKETIEVKPAEVIIIEGILVLTNRKLRNKMDIKIFVDADADDRLMRNIRRDMEERGRSYVETLDHYKNWVKPMHQTFIEPSKKYAHVIVPQGGKNHVAIDMIASKIHQIIQEKK
jgi:uridine kinase